MQAFGTMAETYARETKRSMPELAEDTDRLMDHGGFEKDERGHWKMKSSQVEAKSYCEKASG
jgi:hypothetical protein